MKFDEKFPDAKVGEDARPGLFPDSRTWPCMICLQPTRWVDVGWDGPLCSEECDWEMCKDYMRACGAMLPATPPDEATPSEKLPS